MGMMDRLTGIAPGLTAAGNMVSGVAEVFTPNRTREMELGEEAHARSLAQFAEEFTHKPCNWYDSLVNGLNRLPRPVLALSTMGLIAFSMIDPVAFSVRMMGLSYVPEPLWWLMGAVVSFYFGSREVHYARGRAMAQAMAASAVPLVLPEGEAAPIFEAAPPPDTSAANLPGPEAFGDNAALRDWAALRG